MYTTSENNIVVLLLGPYSMSEIAVKVGVAEKTVKFHTTNIYKKAGVKSRAAFMYKYYSERLGYDTTNTSNNTEREYTVSG
jgi:DNA-binding NarL/FixJ family response regulator